MYTSAAQLYEHDPDFRALIDLWKEHRRCPFVAVDYLLDRELYAQAEGARWAATEPDRLVYVALEHKGEQGGWCGPYPGMDVDCMWLWDASTDTDYADVAPSKRVEDNLGDVRRSDIGEVLVALLDNWKL